MHQPRDVLYKYTINIKGGRCKIMLQKTKNRRVSLSIALATAFLSVFLLPVNEALAMRRHVPGGTQIHRPPVIQRSVQRPSVPRSRVQRPRVSQPRVHHSQILHYPREHYSRWRHHYPAPRLLPLGVALLTIAGIHYYYHQERDIHYRQVPLGYAAVEPPIGAIVTTLPTGYTTFYTGGVRYFYHGGVYYQRGSSGYLVVTPPYTAQSSVDIIEKSETFSHSEHVAVTAQLLNVRSGPGMEHPVIHQVAKGTLLETHGAAPGWLYVKLPSRGQYGWVMSQFTLSQAPSTSG